jgi:hypothetical protein
MPSSRRKFLTNAFVTALFTAIPVKSIFALSSNSRGLSEAGTITHDNDSLAIFSRGTFAFYLHSIFQLLLDADTIEVTLAKIGNLPAVRDGECFSLLFRGGSLNLSQDTYTLVHPALGQFQLLLVPVGPDKYGDQAYLATINRLSPADEANANPPIKSRGRNQLAPPR